MGSSTFLLTAFAAAAFRVVLGAESGINYNTTALSTWQLDEYGEALERTPWALEVRPDIMVALFDSRSYGYLLGDGSFAQPFAFPSQQTRPCTNRSTGRDRMCGGDATEGVGNLLLGGRFRLGRQLTFHPGVFLRLASSNSFIETQDEVSASRIQSRPFNALYGGGWLEFELPIGRRIRLLLRSEAEAWHLGNTDESSLFYIPYGVRNVQPNLILTNQVTTWIDVTRRNGIAVDLNVEDSLFFEDHHRPYAGEEVVLPEDYVAPDTENQLTITGRVVYRRVWLPNLITDLSLGLMGLLPRESDRADPQIGEFRLPIGDWEINLVGGASLMYYGRPRWLTLRFSYERSYDQLHFRNSGAIHDSIDLLAAFGPFSGFSIATTLTWSRFAVEVQRLANASCPRNADGCEMRQESPRAEDFATAAELTAACASFYADQCQYCDSWTRNFNTVGLNLHAEYLHELGDVLLGPFFTGYIYGQIGESIPVGSEFGVDSVCGHDVQPSIEEESCYLPPQHDPVEAILMLGFRLQWSGGNAQAPRRQQDMGGSGEGSRSERRLALQRMTREERMIPGFAYGMRQFDEEEADSGIFGTDDPFGRIGEDGLYEQVIEEPPTDDIEDALEEDEEEEHQWFGEELPPADDDAENEEGDESDEGEGEGDETEQENEGADDQYNPDLLRRDEEP